MVSNHLKRLILSSWVNTIPLYVNWIVPRRSPWGATSFEELTSTLFRCVSGCHFLPSGGGGDLSCLSFVCVFVYVECAGCM
jgi:uncharacterized protein YggT (Ycf19 family)